MPSSLVRVPTQWTKCWREKNKKGKSTNAEKFFNSLIKDAAISARIWKPLDQIDIEKKMFMKICRGKVPTFDGKAI